MKTKTLMTFSLCSCLALGIILTPLPSQIYLESNINLASETTYQENFDCDKNIVLQDFYNTYSLESPVENVIISSENYFKHNISAPLFYALCKFRNILYNDDSSYEYNTFSTHLFNKNSQEFKSLERPTSPDGMAIYDDIASGTLNLVVGANAKYECLRRASKIENILGLKSLDLSTITNLVLDDNALKFISSNELSSMPNLKNLSLKNNSLQNCFVSAEKLENLNLTNNELSQIDLSSAKLNSHINLSFNNFAKPENIVLNENISMVDLAFNQLTQENSYEIIKSQCAPTCKVVFLVQGLKDELTCQDKIAVYNDGFSTNLSAEFSYYAGLSEHDLDRSKFASLGNICKVAPQQNDKLCEYLPIPAGRVELKILNGGLEHTVSAEEKDFLSKKRTYKIKPNAPKILVSVDGKITNSFKQEKDMKVTFDKSSDNFIVNYETVNKHSSLLLSNNGKNFEETEITINSKGQFMILASVLFDGVYSDTTQVILEKYDPNVFSNVFMIVIAIFIIGATIWFVVIWIKDGAQIAPLSSREEHKANTRRKRKLKNNDNKQTSNKTGYTKAYDILEEMKISSDKKEKKKENKKEINNNLIDDEVDLKGNKK